MQYFERHLKEAGAIVARSHEVFAARYLTSAAISCYLRQMIEAWAQV